ncbi:MAG: universal stress protein [Chloroflexi bacterium]|nr:universal stress protein [Chloroflexota bacterium]
MLVPLDGSKLAESVLPHVIALAKGRDVAEVVLLRICEPPSILADYPASLPVSWEKHREQVITDMQNACGLYLDDMERQLREEGFKVRTESRLGDPADEIGDYASKNEVDIIVMASHGRSGLSKWAYGSVAEKVLHSTCVPVLMVRAPGCVPGI